MRKPLIPQEDHDLVLEFAAGKEEAFNILMDRHKNRIFTTIFFIVKERAVRIARNLAIDCYRKDRRGPAIQHENDAYDIFNQVTQHEESIEDKIIQEESAQYVRDLIKQIPEKQREVLIMRHYANMSFKEIADVQGVNINTALGRMRYALLHLRKFIGVEGRMEVQNEEEIY
jgi:RNA polymerase sigma factor (sigma-70 family)